MEDPWSTPWAVDTPSASPGLPPISPAKPAAHDGDGGGGVSTPLDSSPWVAGTDVGARDDDDAWGGWDDGNKNNNDDNTWGAPAEGFSAPWDFVDRERDARDSAVSFGEEARRGPVVKTEDGVRKNAMTLLGDEQDAWMAQEKVTAPERTANAEGPAGNDGPSHGEESRTEDDALSAWKEEDLPSAPQTKLEKATKVQKLVDMYDGIANKAVRLPAEAVHREAKPTDELEVSWEESTSPEPVGDEVGHVDQDPNLGGEEEDARRAETKAASIQDTVVVQEITPLDDETIDEKTTPVRVGEAEQNDMNEEVSPSTGTTQSGSETAMINEELSLTAVEEASTDINGRASPLTESTENPPYPIDLSHLDALFPSSPPSTARPESVPDVVIGDSYTTTSERKTWYRLSATRLRDDADAYRRVTWAASPAVRPKTLRIVRRWMEEDSIAGRVVLGGPGGTTIGASMFNWDSSEPVVEIGELLRQQRVGHGRNGSGEVAPRTPKAEAAGWGGSRVPEPALDSSAEMPRSPWEEDGVEEEEKRTSTERMPPPPMPERTDAAVLMNSIEPTQRQPESGNADEEGDDEDDWGEMVSSPVVDASPAFASLSGSVGLQSTPLRQSFEADFGGVDFIESPAPKPATRANPPPPIRTAGKSGTSGVPSPMWTPSLDSPALEPLRASMDGARIKSAVGTPTLDAPRASTSSNRMSMEHAWTPAISTPTTEYRPSMDNAWTQKVASPSMHTSVAMENHGTGSVATSMSASPSATSLKQPAAKRVSVEGTCTVEEKTIIDAALRSLPDLSYMLR